MANTKNRHWKHWNFWKHITICKGELEKKTGCVSKVGKYAIQMSGIHWAFAESKLTTNCIDERNKNA